MTIVGIHGSIKHGKSTFAQQLSELEPDCGHYESGNIIAEVLDELHWTLKEPFQNDPVDFVNEWMTKLPPILSNVVDVDTTPEQLQFSKNDVHHDPARFEKLFQHAASLQKDPALAKHVVTPENKESYRAGLQGLGGYLVAKVSPTIWYDELLYRVKQDSRRLNVVGGLRYPADANVVRNAGGIIIEIVRPDAPEQDIDDPTEAYRKQIVSDSKIINNGTVEDLRLVTKTVLEDIFDNSIKPTYIAKHE